VQWHLRGMTPSGLRLGALLALFSFVGFESATALGAEARDPLRSIPRAVIQSAALAAVFFLTAAYLETATFAQLHQNLGESESPLRTLATLAGLPLLGPLIDFGALISMFACVLACIIAAARVLLRMGRDGLVPARLAKAHPTNETPAAAVLAVSALVLLPAVLLTARGAAGADIYAWMGSLAVYGFITAYGLVAAALPRYLRRIGDLTPGALALAGAATLAMIFALAGTLYPVPPRPYNWLPFVYLACLAAGIAGSRGVRRLADGRA
jgi:amino acid transporter